MVGCSIRNCKSRSVKGGSIKFFSFPTKESVANEWLRYCGSKTTTKNGRVCSNHFLQSDYIKPLSQVVLNYAPRQVRQLKPDAIPTLQIDSIDVQNTLCMSVEEISEIVCTPDNISCLSECNTMPASIYIIQPDNEVVESSKVVEEKKEKKSDETISVSVSEYESLKRTADEFHVLKNNLEKIFTPGQIRRLMTPDRPSIKWSAEDISAAISLRSVSPKAYRHLKYTIGIPLPSLSTLRKSKFK